ncbi:class I SAM-dependent methyltransferase [Bradyrhizobium sp. 157]|uniref:class I SAM-dependent methyltransferase n=1 Tax=Bradyrhizobium sp. 157 TaxID=2782631 RepID=UPI001FFAC33B|nr:class I SAM-dependent methyltransferase [Bradyrhizobium sp. 157]MCK1642849.1 class I SAM-dependent methyltransferase [Bradyrhizobium sp. 157]
MSDANSIRSTVAAYYSSKLATFGATPQGVDWNSAGSHATRHRQFLRLIGGEREASVLDLGCGFGDFLRFLRAEGHRGAFVGYDVAPDMIAEANRLYGSTPNCRWRVGSEPTETADFAIASGIFNVKGDVPLQTWVRYVHDTMNILARAGRLGFAFNVLSLSSDLDRRRGDLYYADPGEMLTYCTRRYGRSVALLQDYGLYEFTMIVRHT